MNKVKIVIDNISKKEGVDLTLGATAGQLYYAKNKLDLTQKVIDEYNRLYPVKKAK